MRLYIGNLPYNASQGDVESWFSDAGFPLDSVSLVMDRETGQSRGFAFAEIEDAEQAEAVLGQCNGQDMNGRKLVINEARPKAAGGGSRGGGFASRGDFAPRGDFGPPQEQFYRDDFGGGGGGGGGGGRGRGKSRRGGQGNRREPRW